MENKSTIGVIYILTNPSFPEYVKIGYADDLTTRLKALNNSECIPYAFRAFAVYEVQERLSDIAVHRMIDSINPTLRTIDEFDGKKRKKEFFAMSADDAYAIFETIARISGTLDRLHKLTPDGHEISDEKIATEIENTIVYSENASLEKANPEIQALYNKLRYLIVSLGNVSVEPKKYYIAFKAPKNFVDVEVQKYALKLFINMKKGTLNDNEEMARDVSSTGHWGNGDYSVLLKDEADLDYVSGLIEQSYLKNGEKNEQT